MSGQRENKDGTLTPAPAGYPIKLVRDRTPEILNSSGEPGALWYERGHVDRLRWLRLKLAEEVGEERDVDAEWARSQHEEWLRRLREWRDSLGDT